MDYKVVEHYRFSAKRHLMVMNAKNRTLKMHIFLCFQLRNVWFQHDCVPARKASSVKQYLVEEFGEEIIWHGGFQEWLPRSPDLTPVYFFLRGYLKQQVYATPPPTLQDLQRRIADACVNLTPAILHRVQREVQARVQMYMVVDGEKFEHRRSQGVFLY
ncbi:hypothetical protein AVEN_261991-1 [Araneus ventricosus]|uniref:DUF4817 domain-containing protein n=1 Tax=Araneus ventricosus TaxID=182803 RepID=A0A4Y2HCA1_ARAVE|nr:hypothetical protein AVEN_261991-1 [Araneus ventricosus]